MQRTEIEKIKRKWPADVYNSEKAFIIEKYNKLIRQAYYDRELVKRRQEIK